MFDVADDGDDGDHLVLEAPKLDCVVLLLLNLLDEHRKSALKSNNNNIQNVQKKLFRNVESPQPCFPVWQRRFAV